MGPDATRYLLAGSGEKVARPFHLRWLLPWLCGDRVANWRGVWIASWPILAAGVGLVGFERGDWLTGLAAAVFCLALPGMWGPAVVRPVGVDLPAAALSSLGAAAIVMGGDWRATASGVALICVAAAIKETSPMWAACLAWSPWPLLALVVPAVTMLVRRPGMDMVSERFREIHDHPVRTALQYHRDQWRDAWIMVAPWGACLAALYDPTAAVVVVLVLAYGQLFVATDTVRLYTTAAAPTLAVAAALTIPSAWLPLAMALHAAWWVPEQRMMHRG